MHGILASLESKVYSLMTVDTVLKIKKILASLLVCIVDLRLSVDCRFSLYPTRDGDKFAAQRALP